MLPPFQNRFQDLRLALRRLRSTPGFTALAVLTLALGVGAHTSVFALVDTLFVRPLPLPDSERLVGVYESRDGSGFRPLSYPDYLDHRQATTVFSALAAHYPGAPLMLEAGGRTEEIDGSVVSPGYFDLLGVEPVRGRFFRPEEGAPGGGHPVAVVSHRFWRGRLGGDEDVVGTAVEINGRPFTVVGVAPEGFRGILLGRRPDVWIPTAMAGVGYRWCDARDRHCTWLNLVGRLAPGRTLEDARGEMAVLGRRVHEARPAPDGTVRGLAVAELAGVHPAARPGMLRLAGLLLGAVTLVVLVAGANVGGLLVARGLTRGRETAIRLALGASGRRVAAPFLAETLLLAAGGGACGLLVAAWFGELVGSFYPAETPLDVSLGFRSLVYAALLSVVLGVLVGLVPVLQARRPGLADALREGVTTGRWRRPRLLGVLVVAQVALSLVLLSSTGLLVRSLDRAGSVGAVDPESVVRLRLRPRLVGYEPEEARAFTREAVRRLETLPGVDAVGIGRLVPPWPGVDPREVASQPAPAGTEPPEPSGIPDPWLREVGPGFFDTFGFTLLRGRSFDGRDAQGAAPVTVVNRTYADLRWPGEDAVGRFVALPAPDEPGERSHEVIGVVEDRFHRSLAQVPPPVVYTPYWQDPTLIDARLGVRVGGEAEALLPALRETLRSIDPRVPVTEVQTMADRLETILAPVHLAGRMLAVSGGLALLLSAVGLYGVLALAVARRTRDIGIRMALGGTRLRVVAAVVRDAVLLVGIALGLGLLASMAAGRALAHYLYGVGPGDPLAHAAGVVLLMAIAALASWWPARAAASVDPRVALRAE